MKLFLHKQGIFIPKSMKEEFDAAAELCSAAIAHRYVEERGARLDRHDDLEFRSRGPKTLETIKDQRARRTGRVLENTLKQPRTSASDQDIA